MKQASGTQHVGVIGSGLAGLAAACTLAARGHRVEVFEKNPWLGGKAAQLRESGFRFDMGPTILIQPSVLRKIFDEAGRKLEDYIPMVRLDPQWRCFFEDGTRLDLMDNAAQMAAQLEAIWPKMGAGYLKFLDMSQQLHSISDRFFFWRSVGSMRDTMDVGGAFDLNVLKDVMRMRLGKSVAGTIREFIPDANTAQMLDHFVQYVGSSPDASPAILCAIGHMQMEEGIWYPLGGTRAVPKASSSWQPSLASSSIPRPILRRFSLMHPPMGSGQAANSPASSPRTVSCIPSIRSSLTPTPFAHTASSLAASPPSTLTVSVSMSPRARASSFTWD